MKATSLSFNGIYDLRGALELVEKEPIELSQIPGNAQLNRVTKLKLSLEGPFQVVLTASEYMATVVRERVHGETH